MDQWDRELGKGGIQMAGAAAKGMGNVMAAVIDGLIEKGVFSIEEGLLGLPGLDRPPPATASCRPDAPLRRVQRGRRRYGGRGENRMRGLPGMGIGSVTR